MTETKMQFFETRCKMVGLPDSEKNCVNMFNYISTEYWRVTDRRADGWTDGRTSCGSIVRAIHSIAW